MKQTNWIFFLKMQKSAFIKRDPGSDPKSTRVSGASDRDEPSTQLKRDTII